MSTSVLRNATSKINAILLFRFFSLFKLFLVGKYMLLICLRKQCESAGNLIAVLWTINILMHYRLTGTRTPPPPPPHFGSNLKRRNFEVHKDNLKLGGYNPRLFSPDDMTNFRCKPFGPFRPPFRRCLICH